MCGVCSGLDTLQTNMRNKEEWVWFFVGGALAFIKLALVTVLLIFIGGR